MTLKVLEFFSSAEPTWKPPAPAVHVRPSYKSARAGCDCRHRSAPGVNMGQALGAEEEQDEMHAQDEETQPQRSI